MTIRRGGRRDHRGITGSQVAVIVFIALATLVTLARRR
jgi:hypothetical protein